MVVGRDLVDVGDQLIGQGVIVQVQEYRYAGFTFGHEKQQL